jgi:DNA-binding MarR family transcriptional regulator
MTPEEDIITGCVTAIQALRANSAAHLSMNHYELLFYIYLHDGITRQEIINRIPQSKPSSIKRYINDLLIEHTLLVETNSDEDFRVKHLHLNENGHRIIKTVVNKMQECATCLKTNLELEPFTQNKPH